MKKLKMYLFWLIIFVLALGQSSLVRADFETLTPIPPTATPTVAVMPSETPIPETSETITESEDLILVATGSEAETGEEVIETEAPSSPAGAASPSGVTGSLSKGFGTKEIASLLIILVLLLIIIFQKKKGQKLPAATNETKE